VPSGAAVIRYDGARGLVWRIKYIDGNGRQVKETLGRAKDGWTKRRAEAALRARLTDVARDGYRRPEPVTFTAFAREWLDTYPDEEAHRRTTRADYRAMVENHFIPVFGEKRLADIETADIDSYVAAKRKAGLAARTLSIHVTRLGSIFESARRKRMIPSNPARDAKRPKVARSRWTILAPAEVSALLRSFDELIHEAGSEPERQWRETAKTMCLAMLYAWLRRGELLGLHWRDVELGHPDGPRLHVRETFVRGQRSDPKTDEGARTIALEDDGPLAEELWQHRRRSLFDGDDELVFCHPEKGSPVPSGYFGPIVMKALARAGVDRPMREFHDWRHTGITNAAAAGMEPMAIMRMAGHADFKTTQKYIDLAGVIFSDEVAKLSAWYGASGTKTRYQVGADPVGSGSESGTPPPAR
jgi:site-specific recombinase XerD